MVRAMNDGGVETLVRQILQSQPEIRLVITSSELSERNQRFLVEFGINYRVLGKNSLRSLLLCSSFWVEFLSPQRVTIWYHQLAIFALFRPTKSTTIHVGIGCSKSPKDWAFNLCLRASALLPWINLNCASDSVRRSRGLSKSVPVVHNFVEQRKPTSQAITVDPQKLIFVGRWEVIKNNWLLERFMEKVGRSFFLFVIGSEGEKSDLDNIKFCGIKEFPFNNNASCLVFFPSPVEGFGLVLIEALYANKKVITWNRNVAGELLKESKRVLFIEPSTPDVEKLKNFVSGEYLSEPIEDSLAYVPMSLSDFIKVYT